MTDTDQINGQHVGNVLRQIGWSKLEETGMTPPQRGAA